MSTIQTSRVILGQSGNDNHNFLLDTDIAGALRWRRGAAGGGGNILSINSAGIPLDKDGLDLRPLGVGQTWQNVLGSRAQGATYTNSTGRPILVAFSGYSSVAAGSVVVGGVTLYSELGRSTYFDGLPVGFLVPNGTTYVISGFGYVGTWAELRT